jgi:hypothetical protein
MTPARWRRALPAITVTVNTLEDAGNLGKVYPDMATRKLHRPESALAEPPADSRRRNLELAGHLSRSK